MSQNLYSTILIVDDQPDIIDSVTGYLKTKENNYKFLQAINGQMACEVALKRMPDLIIMDWEMPIMNGYEALLEIKSNPQTNHIPVIMATGRSSSDDLDKALNAGAADYIRKPIEKQELSARVRTCLNLSMYIQEIKAQNDKLIDLNREKDGLVNVVAHDLRSPLSTISGFVELMRRENSLSTSQNEFLTVIDKMTREGIFFIDDLLDVHSFEFGKSKVVLSEFDVNEFLEDWVKTLEQQLRRKEQKLITQIQLGNSTFKTDHFLLRRIMNNLLSNAIKFSEKKANIYVSVQESENHINFSVRDEGPGISDEDKKNMFKRFQKLSARPTDGESSNGLGLSIIKTLVEKLKGKIEVNSVLGEGTEFKISLPREASYIETV